MVLEAFRGTRAPGTETRHKNNVRTDNRLRNLQWATKAVNEGDKDRFGTHTRGERNGAAKLTQREADAIRESDERGDVLAKRYNVSEATVSRIRHGHRYPGTPSACAHS